MPPIIPTDAAAAPAIIGSVLSMSLIKASSAFASLRTPMVVITPTVLAATPDLPVKSVKDLIALAKTKPGALAYGSSGVGSTTHIAGEMLASMAGIRLSPVPFKGTPDIITNVLNGSVQITFDNAGLWAPQIKAGKVHALAVSSARRSPLLPDVPTLQEAGLPGYEAVTFAGISVPKGTPKEIIDKVNRDVQAVIDGPEFRSKMAAGEVTTTSPESYRQFLAAEQAKWGKVARDIGLTVN